MIVAFLAGIFIGLLELSVHFYRIYLNRRTEKS